MSLNAIYSQFATIVTREFIMSYNTLILSLKGGANSGNHGHQGIKGKRGGSAKGSLTGEQQRLQQDDALLNDPDVLKDLIIPVKLYHVTDRANLKSILSNGLKVGSQRTSSEGLISGVYLTDNPSDVSSKQSDINIKDPVILEIDTSKLRNLRLDPEYFYYDNKTTAGAKDYIKSVNNREDEFAMYSPTSIPASAIALK
jgi:hypothetical protein